MTEFYDAWAELDELDEFIGLEPVKLPEQCAHLDGQFCSMRKPCAYCTMVMKYGKPPSRDKIGSERTGRQRWLPNRRVRSRLRWG